MCAGGMLAVALPLAGACDSAFACGALAISDWLTIGIVVGNKLAGIPESPSSLSSLSRTTADSSLFSSIVENVVVFVVYGGENVLVFLVKTMLFLVKALLFFW